MLEMDDDQIALAERRGDFNVSGANSEADFKKGRGKKKPPGVKAYTMRIE